MRERFMVKPGVNVGYISLLTMFMVLCLAVFIALALTRAKADHSLTDRTGETAVSFFEAQNQLQDFLCEIDGMLSEGTGIERLADEPWRQEGMAYDSATGVISAQWPAGERLLLRAEIRISPGDAVRYKVLSIVMSPIQENLHKSLDNLWKGDEIFNENSGSAGEGS